VDKKHKNKKELKHSKSKKIIIVTCLVLAFLSLTALLTTALLLEPAVKIKGYQTLDTAKLQTNQHSIVIYDKTNEIRQNLVSNKIYVSIENIPTHVKEAFISIEDKRFYEHNGIDYYRIIGAARKNLKNKRYSEGASTISQQVIKNTHLSHDKNLNRKINEIRVARSLERKLNKEEILQIYLNKIYFGNGAYGIGAAAKLYFGKNTTDLSINEGAFLAGIINNPSRYNPYTNLDNANERRKLVLSQMYKSGRINEKELHYLNENISPIAKKRTNLKSYGHSILIEASKILGVSTTEILEMGYTIYTNLDFCLHQNISNIINNYNFETKENTLTHVVVMTKYGEVLVNFSNSHFNLENHFRQPGSIIKPAISYAPAFEKREFCLSLANNSLLATNENNNVPFVPLTKILDQSKNFNGYYSPKNFKDINLGWTNLSESLKQSQNIPAVELVQLLGIEYCKEIAMKLGMRFDKKDASLSIALGGLTKGVNLFETISPYQAFANNGAHIEKTHIDRIVDRNGITIYKNSKKEKQAISIESAYFINSILSETALKGTAKRIGALGAAKTGTVGTINGNSDAYVVAYTDEHIVAVWMGTKCGGLMPNTSNGATHPSAIARRILEILPAHNGFNKPSTIIQIDLNAHEYLKNNKMVIACDNLKPKDRLIGEFILGYLP